MAAAVPDQDDVSLRGVWILPCCSLPLQVCGQVDGGREGWTGSALVHASQLSGHAPMLIWLLAVKVALAALSQG